MSPISAILVSCEPRESKGVWYKNKYDSFLLPKHFGSVLNRSCNRRLMTFSFICSTLFHMPFSLWKGRYLKIIDILRTIEYMRSAFVRSTTDLFLSPHTNDNFLNYTRIQNPQQADMILLKYSTTQNKPIYI